MHVKHVLKYVVCRKGEGGGEEKKNLNQKGLVPKRQRIRDNFQSDSG